MTIAIQHFYSPLPIRGVRFSDQIDKFGDDFNALSTIVRQAFADIGPSSGSNDLAGMSFGEVDFRHRWRWFYDKGTDQFILQFNTGTEATPVWVNIITVADTTGRTTFHGSGGVDLGSLGFYGVTVALTGNQPVFREVNKINFEGSAFYIDQNTGNTDEVTVSTRRMNIRKTVHGFPNRLFEWQANHNLATTFLTFNCINTKQRTVTPTVADFSDPNVAYFYFTAAVAGFATILG